MIQTMDAVVSAQALDEARAKTESMPLRGRVTTMESEVASLKQRLAKMQTDVGVSDAEGDDTVAPPPQAPAAAAEEPPAVEEATAPEEPAAFLDENFEDAMKTASSVANKRKASSKPKYISLVAVNTMRADLKTTVGTLEGDVATLKSKTSRLENVVAGETFDNKASLLQQSAGSALLSRIVSLEEEIDTLRSRMTNLEHTVEG